MKLKLIVIEDDPALLKEMKDYFEGAYEVGTADSLARARELLENFSPDAAVLDLILPDGNGIELLNSRVLTCPTVILTTMDADDDHAEGLDAGAKDYLVKPVSLRISRKASVGAPCAEVRKHSHFGQTFHRREPPHGAVRRYADLPHLDGIQHSRLSVSGIRTFPHGGRNLFRRLWYALFTVNLYQNAPVQPSLQTLARRAQGRIHFDAIRQGL